MPRAKTKRRQPKRAVRSRQPRDPRRQAIDAIRLDHVTRWRRAADKRAEIQAASASRITTNKKKPKQGMRPFLTIGQQLADNPGIRTLWQPLDDFLTGDSSEQLQTIPGTGRGWPRGRIVEIYGPPDVGKTTFTLQQVVAAQRAGLVCGFLDVEHTLDLQYAAKLGVDFKTLLFDQPNSAEDALNQVDEFVKRGGDLMVVDSVAALQPEEEEDTEVTASPVAIQARMLSTSLRKLTRRMEQTERGTVILFVNQIRTKIGVMFGNPETTSGGNPLKFYASIRLDIRNVGQIKKNQRKVGHRSRIRAVKNKAAPPFREIYCEVLPNRGIVAVFGDLKKDQGGTDEDE